MKFFILMVFCGLLNTAAQANERIIPLAPHITEMIYAIGAGDQIVGVMKFSDYPEAAKKLPVIGDAYALNYERILALKPTQVYAWKGGTPEKQIDKLRELKLNVMVMNTDTIKDIDLNMAYIARNTNAPLDSINAIAQLEQAVQTLENRYRNVKPVSVFYELWPRPLMTIGHAHPINEAIRLCGGVNVFDDVAQPTATVSREALRARKPQLLLSAAGDDGDKHKVKQTTAALLFPATARSTLNGDHISRMGPRFVLGVKAMCEAIDKVRVKS